VRAKERELTLVAQKVGRQGGYLFKTCLNVTCT